MVLQIGSWYLHGDAPWIFLGVIAVLALATRGVKSSNRKAKARRRRPVGGRR
jgi:hypothetical protein